MINLAITPLLLNWNAHSVNTLSYSLAYDGGGSMPPIYNTTSTYTDTQFSKECPHYNFAEFKMKRANGHIWQRTFYEMGRNQVWQ